MKVKQIRLENNTLEEIKELAANEDRSVNSVIRDAIEQYLASKKKKPESNYLTEKQVKEIVAKEFQKLSESIETNKEQMRQIAKEEIEKSSDSLAKVEPIKEPKSTEGMTALEIRRLERQRTM